MGNIYGVNKGDTVRAIKDIPDTLAGQGLAVRIGNILDVISLEGTSTIMAKSRHDKSYVIRLYDGEYEPIDVSEYESDTKDSVNSPSHYTQAKFETIEVIEEWTKGYDDGFVSYCVGNALKYLARAHYKHEEPSEHLRKAAKYIEFALNSLEKECE